MHILQNEKSGDTEMMQIALDQAREAARQGEVPVGAVLVDGDGFVITKSGNNIIKSSDPTGHAEMHVIRAAGKALNNYRLPNTTLFVTLEPCAMCATAMVHARISRLVFGAEDPKTGAIVSKYSIGGDDKLNHSFSVTGGVLAKQCSQLLKKFFQIRRTGKKVG